MAKQGRQGLTDEQVEREIERLTASPHVKLARAEIRAKYRKRQYLYGLRQLEKHGKELADAGITEEMFKNIEKECELPYEEVQ